MKSISEYRIVFTDGEGYSPIEREAAYSLRRKLSKLYGCELSIGSASDEGACIRFVRSDENDKRSCFVKTDGQDILLGAACSAGYDAVIRGFIALVESDGTIAQENIDLVLDNGDKSISEEYGNLRVIYHNIFGYDREPTINAKKRFEFQTLLYREYGAQMICLQEYDTLSRELMTPILLAAGYLEVEVDYSALGKNCSPIFYDPKRFELIDKGYHPFFYVSPVNPKVCNNGNTKNFTWGVFNDKKTGKSIVVISLHFYYAADAVVDRNERAESNIARIKNAEELLDVINNEIKPKYPTLPIVLGGDMNACYNHALLDSVKNSVTKGRTVLDMMNELEGGKCAQRQAKVFTSNITTIHAYPLYDVENDYYTYCADLSDLNFDRAIDHVYTIGENITPMTFHILDNTVAKKCSDHCPIVVDLLLD